jgi:ribosomal protein S18 acetylase RimI-like enzyme
MDQIIYRVARRDDYRDLSVWLVEMSQRPQQHCLHTWAGETSRALERSLVGYWDDSELCYLLALQAGRLVGAMGSEYDEELKRGWLHGPHATVDDWQGMATDLYSRLRDQLPKGLVRLDAHMNVENVRGRRFYAGQDFQERDTVSHEFRLEPGDLDASSARTGVHLQPQHEESFKPLFERLFPAAYYSGERVIRMIGQSHQVLVAAEGDEVVGFVAASVEGKGSPGEVQFLGVREDRRRLGLGKGLLLSAVDWLLNEAKVPWVGLNVNEDRIHARELYESVGFRLRFTGMGLEKNLIP